MVVSRKKLTFRNRNYAVLWWEKRKNSVLRFVLNSFLHCVRITHSTHFVYKKKLSTHFILHLVLRLLCYVRSYAYNK